jgi:hypothetical protein
MGIDNAENLLERAACLDQESEVPQVLNLKSSYGATPLKASSFNWKGLNISNISMDQEKFLARKALKGKKHSTSLTNG